MAHRLCWRNSTWGRRQEAGASSNNEKRRPKFLGARERVPTPGKEERKQPQAAHLCQAQHRLPHTCVPQGSRGGWELHPRRWLEAERWSRRQEGWAGWLPQGPLHHDFLEGQL